MVNPINPITPISTGTAPSLNSNQGGPDFKKILENAIDKVNSTVQNAEQMSQDFATGKTSDIQGVLIAAEKADIMLQLTDEVRNKIVSAYQDIMRMQI